MNKRKYFVYQLVFNFGYDECELINLDVNDLKSLWISLLYAKRVATFNGHKAVRLTAGKLIGG